MKKTQDIILRNFLILILIVILFFIINKHIFKKDSFTVNDKTHECYGKRDGFPCKTPNEYCHNESKCKSFTLKELSNLKKPDKSLCNKANKNSDEEYKKWAKNYDNSLNIDPTCPKDLGENCSNEDFREKCPGTCYACSEDDDSSYFAKIDPYIAN